MKDDPLGTLKQATDEMLAAGTEQGEVRLTSAEGFAELNAIHHLNSRGLDVQDELSNVNVEFVLQYKKGDEEVETFREYGRRRAMDLNIQAEVEQNAQLTRDLMRAGSPTNWEGPVVLHDNPLVVVVGGDHLTPGVLQVRRVPPRRNLRKCPNWRSGNLCSTQK